MQVPWSTQLLWVECQVVQTILTEEQVVLIILEEFIMQFAVQAEEMILDLQAHQEVGRRKTQVRTVI